LANDTAAGLEHEIDAKLTQYGQDLVELHGRLALLQRVHKASGHTGQRGKLVLVEPEFEPSASDRRSQRVRTICTIVHIKESTGSCARRLGLEMHGRAFNVTASPGGFHRGANMHERARSQATVAWARQDRSMGRSESERFHVAGSTVSRCRTCFSKSTGTNVTPSGAAIRAADSSRRFHCWVAG